MKKKTYIFAHMPLRPSGAAPPPGGGGWERKERFFFIRLP